MILVRQITDEPDGIKERPEENQIAHHPVHEARIRPMTVFLLP